MSLSEIRSLRLAAVLEHFSNQLDLLGSTLTVQINKERGHAAARERARLTKLRRDCQHAAQLISTLCLELEERQSFSSLHQVVEEAEQRKRAEIMRKEAERELEKRKQALQRQQEELQQKTEKLKEIQNTKKQLEELSTNMTKKKKLTERITEVQLQQTEKQSRHAEKQLEDKVELLHKQLEMEMRVHEASERILKNQGLELQKQLQQWQQLTKQMQQEKEQELNSVCCKRTVNLDRLMEMRRKFKEMEQVVIEDREEQERVRQQQAEARAATKLQAWWRGCMVRRGLGSFKKAEKGKKVKKDGKKKKK